MTTPSTLTDRPALPDGLAREAVVALAERSVRQDSVPSFQALLAALSRAVDATREPVARARAAALSLRQQDTVDEVSAHLDGLLGALAAGVSTEGRCLTPRRTPGDLVRAVLRPTAGWRQRADAAPTWVSAVAAAVEALGETAEHARTLAHAQPASSSARCLGERVADTLRADSQALLADVARMVD